MRSAILRGRGVAHRLAGVLVPALLLATAAAGCGGEETAPELPSASELEGTYGPSAEVALNGNVVDVRVEQDPRQLERGGPLWAKVGPYIYLFSPQTQRLFDRHPGVAAVRVRTVTPGGTIVAEAMLRRDALNALTWKKAVAMVGRARQEGTDKPGLVEDLVQYGEQHTEHEYNESYL